MKGRGMRRTGVLVLGVLLLVGGILALVYGGFSYPKETHGAKLGPVEVQVTENDRVEIPQWVGIAAIAVGGGLLYLGGRR